MSWPAYMLQAAGYVLHAAGSDILWAGSVLHENVSDIYRAGSVLHGMVMCLMKLFQPCVGVVMY